MNPIWRGLTALVAVLSVHACSRVQDERAATAKAVELGVIEQGERELGPDEPIALQVQALDEDGDPVDDVSVFFVLSDSSRLAFAAPSEAVGQDRIFVKTGQGLVGGAKAAGVASVEVVLAAGATAGEVGVAVGLAAPPEDAAGDAFVTFRITAKPANQGDASLPPEEP